VGLSPAHFNLVQRLYADQREVLLLKDALDYSLYEIAASLQIDYFDARTLLTSARRQVRQGQLTAHAARPRGHGSTRYGAGILSGPPPGYEDSACARIG
jgi:hypothetical protein